MKAQLFQDSGMMDKDEVKLTSSTKYAVLFYEIDLLLYYSVFYKFLQENSFYCSYSDSHCFQKYMRFIT